MSQVPKVGRSTSLLKANVLAGIPTSCSRFFHIKIKWPWVGSF